MVLNRNQGRQAFSSNAEIRRRGTVYSNHLPQCHFSPCDKRHGLTQIQLEDRIESELGKKAGVYDLTKREAGDIIDVLSQNGAPAANGNGRNRISR